MAWHITDTHDYLVSECSVYRLLKAQDLVTRPPVHSIGRLEQVPQSDQPDQ